MEITREKVALLLLRLIVGAIFFEHGAQKVFGLFGGPGLTGFAQWMQGYGVPTFVAYLAAFAECGGGVLMILGIATEFGALMTIPVMIGAIFIVHGTQHYFIQDKGFEYPFNLILLAIAVIIGGPGTFAIWNPWHRS